MVEHKRKDGCGVKVTAEALNDPNTPLFRWKNEQATHRLVDNAMGATMPCVCLGLAKVAVGDAIAG